MPINEMIRLSVSEAAKLFGVNTQTIRRAIQAGDITYIVVQGRYKINFESMVKWSQRNTLLKKKLETRGIGQFIGQWKIKNKLYSPNPQVIDSGATGATQNESKIEPKTPPTSPPTLPI